MVILSKKNTDGSYDTSPYLFDGIDLYHGDKVSKLLELAPASDGSKPKKVKLQIVCKKEGVDYEFTPSDEEGFLLKTEKYSGLTLWFEDELGKKYHADRNGIVSIINELSAPLTVKLWVVADRYTIPKLVEGVVLDDVSIVIWSI